jgi:sulfotransferase
MLFFISGLPRSGSTLLANLLGQNPNHAVTPTSGLIEMFTTIRNSWKKYIEFKAEGLDKAKPKVLGALKGLLYGFFGNELAQGKIAFDKSRGWLQFIEEIEEVLEQEIRILVTVRDVRDICASFEKIYQNRKIDFDYPIGKAFFETQTIIGRCEYLLSPGGVVGVTVNRLRDALNRKIKNRLIVIPIKNLTTHPTETLLEIHNNLGLQPYLYDTTNVKQVTFENDLWHGMDLHTIKSEVKPISENTWKGVLPDKYAESLEKRYKDINDIAKGKGNDTKHNKQQHSS